VHPCLTDEEYATVMDRRGQTEFSHKRMNREADMLSYIRRLVRGHLIGALCVVCMCVHDVRMYTQARLVEWEVKEAEQV
jgi:hypothetical protein